MGFIGCTPGAFPTAEGPQRIYRKKLLLFLMQNESSKSILIYLCKKDSINILHNILEFIILVHYTNCNPDYNDMISEFEIRAFVDYYWGLTVPLTQRTTVSEWLLFNANSAIFQLYHDKNKLIFNVMMMKSALY